MAVVTVKSANITNLDASPRVSTQAGVGAGYRVKEIDDFVAIANGDSIGSKYLVARIPSTVRVKDIWLENTAITSAVADIGLYYADRVEDLAGGSPNLGLVISAAFFGSAVSMNAANNPPVNVTNESTTYTVDKRSQPIWQAASLAADPGGKFDIVLTLTAAATAAGNAYLKVGYVE